MLLKKILLLLIFTNAINFSFSQEKRLKVYAFVAEECPVSIAMASSLRSVSESYASAKTEFYLVFPMSTSTAEAAALFQTENKLSRFIIKIDRYQTLTKKLGALVSFSPSGIPLLTQVFITAISSSESELWFFNPEYVASAFHGGITFDSVTYATILP